MRDLHNRISVVQCVPAITSVGNGALAAVVVDRQNGGKLSQSCELVMNVGAKTDGAIAAVLSESDTGAFGGEENAVAASDLNGVLTDFALADGAAGANSSFKVGYRGSKRYLKLVLTTSSNAGSLPVSVTAVLGHIGHNAAV